MSVSLLKLAADLNLSLAAAVSVGATSATLQSATDSDGVALPNGKYGFTVDGDNLAKEFIVCDLSGTALTNIQNISRQGVATTGFANYHRVGAVVTITDWAILSRILNNLTGTTGFDAGFPLIYDGQPLLSDPTAIPTVQFVLDTASGGTVTFDRQIIPGDAGENVLAGDWVYFDTSDGEWYLTDADNTAKSLNVRIGKAIGAGTNGNPISGGIFVSGTETVGTYVAGTTYYLSNTAGALSTSAGTNPVVVGIGDANGDLQLSVPTFNQVNALAGGGSSAPSSSNKFVTEDTLKDIQVFTTDDTWTKPTGAKEVEVYVIGAGGGGGGGYGNGSSESGGAGGGGGGFVHTKFLPSELTATVAITVGEGGAGGLGTAGSPTAGTNGEDSSFGTYLIAQGGVGGTVGQTGGGTAAGVTSRLQSDGIYSSTPGTSAPGASGLGNTSAGAGGAGVSSTFFVPLGGGGGSDDGQAAGAGGGIITITTVAGGAGGASAGLPGQTGNSSATLPQIGTGGGGGRGNTGANTGGAGGNGGLYGGGGGGGGMSESGAGGAGGAGANGVVVVITTF